MNDSTHSPEIARLSDPGTYSVKEVPTCHGQQDTSQSAPAPATAATTTVSDPLSTPATASATDTLRAEAMALTGVLNRHVIGHHAQTIEGFRPCRCSCGTDIPHCRWSGGWLQCDEMHRAHLAEVILRYLRDGGNK